MERKKILFFITRMDQGGAQESLLLTLKNLDRRKYDCYVAVGKGGRLDSRLQSCTKNVFFLTTLKHDVNFINLIYDFLTLFKMRNVLKKVKPNIVHTSTPKAGILGRIATHFFYKKAKIIHTFHGLGFGKEHAKNICNIFVYLEKYCSRFTDTLVFVSHSNEQEAKQLGIGKGIHTEIIRAGINFNPIIPLKFDPITKKASLGIPKKSKVVLSIANFKVLKNPLHFVLAAYQVISQIKNVYFVFTGEGPLRKTAEKLAKSLNIEKNIIFPGWRDDTLELLAISDVYVSTSLREGLPMSLLEAMSMRVPAVCYNVDGISEIVSDNKNGFLVVAKDINALASKLKTILRHSALRERFEMAIDKRDFSEFSVSTMIKKQEKLYDKLVPTHSYGRKRFFSKRFGKFKKNDSGVKNGLRN